MLKLPTSVKLMDTYLPRFLILVLVCLLVVQTSLALIPSSGFYLNTALRLEGEPLHQDELSLIAGGITTLPWASLNLRLLDFVSLPEVKIMLDGQEVGSFLKNELTINVKHGNMLVIHNPYPYAITVKITKSTPNILKPANLSQVSGLGRLSFEPIVVK